MMSHKSEKDIEKLLSEMPDIKDDQSFDTYYQNVANQVDNKPKKNRPKRGFYFPALVTAAVLLLSFMVAMPFLSQDEAGDEMSTNEASMEDSDMESAESSEGSEDSREFSTAEDESSELNEVPSEESGEEEFMDSAKQVMTIEELNEMGLTTRVIQEDIARNQEDWISFYAMDGQANYLVPLTYVSDGEGKEAEFNNAQTKIEVDGLFTNIFQYAEYIGQNSENEPLIEVNDEEMRQVGGSALETGLIDSIHAFYGDLGYEQVSYQNKEGNTPSFSNYGEFTNLPISVRENYSYLLYEPEDTDTSLLLPVPADDQSVEVALEEMKNDNEDFSLYATIPNEFNFVVQNSDEEVLEIGINDEFSFESTNEHMVLIEAILLTAKSYGYEAVVFSVQQGVKEVGPYQMNQPIKVPEYINPME
ncbi:hypothetical protein CEY16_03755 [Halalkalibacillus sediminis]|uniref:Sigma-X negative effector n=1 Tax=Halalkalibacillus sediminis TaxID=2018042 RepID=A0A2I0QX16_9BACI|nr:GerMN domain-containing protein [Halalkalibacillus sediminis]PKR78881.1 hypothetical protein CEY16_03755 [Halalkalibacillus sediminis]